MEVFSYFADFAGGKIYSFRSVDFFIFIDRSMSCEGSIRKVNIEVDAVVFSLRLTDLFSCFIKINGRLNLIIGKLKPGIRFLILVVKNGLAIQHSIFIVIGYS
jgi:hypothetical protein